jgi:hypothetical protein
MEKRIVAAIAGVVWLSAVGSAAVLSYALNRPAVTVEGTGLQTAAFQGESCLRPATDEVIGSSVLELPAVVIVGEAQPATGVAEMQGVDDVIIGPGTVTYPAGAPSAR